MMITMDQLSKVTETDFVAEASTLGFPVGKWPKELVVVRAGVGREYRLMKVTEQVATYWTMDRKSAVQVFND